MKTKRKLKKEFKILFILLLVFACAFCFFIKDNKKVIEEKPVETFEVISTPVATPTTTTASLFMTGDALLHTAIEYDVLQSDGTYAFTLLDRIGPIAQKYDLRYYNQETVLGGDDLGISSYPRFNGPTSWGDYMLSLGFNLISLANNHSLDMGTYGLTNSINYWNSKDVVTSGTYLSQEDYDAIEINEINGIKYAFISYTYGTNGIEKEYPYLVAVYTNHEEELLNKIANAKKEADVVIVAIHWGIEYQFNPSDEQKSLAQKMADSGADIIIGNHPHVIQPVQWLNDGKTICFYALGNLVAAQHDTSLIEMMASLNINKITYPDGSSEISLSDVKTDLMYCYRDSNGMSFDIIPFSQVDEEHLPNYKDVYEEYKKVILSLDDSITIGGID